MGLAFMTTLASSFTTTTFPVVTMVISILATTFLFVVTITITLLTTTTFLSVVTITIALLTFTFVAVAFFSVMTITIALLTVFLYTFARTLHLHHLVLLHQTRSIPGNQGHS